MTITEEARADVAAELAGPSRAWLMPAKWPGSAHRRNLLKHDVEARCAAERGVTGRNRGRYQRAFHRAVKEVWER